MTGYEDIILEVLSEVDLKRKFINDPKSVLKERGFWVEDEIEYKVVEETKNIRYIIIPYLNDSISPSETLEKRRSKSIIINCPFGIC